MRGLYRCLRRDSPEELQTLISSTGADVNKKDGTGQPPLFQAVQQGSVACTKLLLDLGADPNVTDDTSGLSPLCQAADMGRLDLAQVLVSKGADPDFIARYERSALVLAVICHLGGLDVVKYLADVCMNLNHSSKIDGTALTVACYKGMKEKVVCLLEAGADINQKDKKGLTPLETACKYFEKNLIIELLDRGAHPRGGLIYLMCREEVRENMELVDRFLKAGVDVNFRPDIQTKSALSMTMFRNNEEMFKFLIRHGAEVGESLHLAVFFRMESFFGDLVMAGATPHLEIYSHVHKLGIKYPEKLMSPFNMALDKKNFQMASCFLSAWFLHSSDIHHVIHGGELRDALQADDLSGATNCLHDVITQPFSLVCLSFVNVSMSVGFGRNREERICQLPIPAAMRNRLLFRGLAKELYTKYPQK